MRPVFENFSEFVKNYKIILEEGEPSLSSNKGNSSVSSEEETPAVKKGIKKIKDQILGLFKKKEESKYAKGDSEENYPKIKPKKFYFDRDLNKFVVKYTSSDERGKYKKWEIPQEDLDQMASDKDIDELFNSIGDDKKYLDITKEKLKEASSALDKEATDILINPLIDFVQENIKKKPGSSQVLGRNIINLKANAHLQSILKELGLLKSKAGPSKDGITCYFNGETEKALEKLSGMKSISVLDPEEIDLLKDYILEDGRSYNKEFRKKIIKSRDEALKKKKIEIKPYIDTGLTLSYYDRQWKEDGSYDYKLKLTGNIIDDMYIFNSKKEGGLSDAATDTGPSQYPCPYEFDAKTGTLNFEGKEYKLAINPHLKDSISSITGTSKSNRWHTSRGVIWPTWQSTAPKLGITNPLEVAKSFFEMTDSNVKKVYEISFYKEKVKDPGLETISPLVNHCIGTSMWGSIVHGKKTIANTLKSLKEYGYSSMNDAIEKVGEKIVTELIILEQIKLYSSYDNAPTYITGWINGFLNFHRYFVPKYADLPPKEEFPKEYAKREAEGENGYSNLDVA